ncbi:hypothetical protein ABZV75_22335 [Streptomyces flaveolus]|uniref:hypothetical protein n=1 Tax=Streptomyces flaveolus TaxID=67297 RepID=UPI0033A3D82A
MARWSRSRRRPLPVERARHRDGGGPGEAEQPARAGARLAGLRETLAGIGTTLDAATTHTELTRAAVMCRTPDTVSGYDAITGDAGLLPDVRWAAAAAHEAQGPVRQ